MDYYIYPYMIPCEVYLGTIGYRGNKPIFEDEKSRFIVVDVGTGKNKMSTQYGFHKYLKTESNAVFPFYELKFNARGLPKRLWSDIYDDLNGYGYYVRESSNSNLKALWLGDISLNDPDVESKVGNLLEGLLAVTIVKSHYKQKEKGSGYNFSFLED